MWCDGGGGFGCETEETFIFFTARIFSPNSLTKAMKFLPCALDEGKKNQRNGSYYIIFPLISIDRLSANGVGCVRQA